MVVDDDPVTRNICSKILRSVGYRVVLAHDGSEALAILERSNGIPLSMSASHGSDELHVDLVITDIHMPTKSGIELLSEVRSAEHLASIKVIIMGSNTLSSLSQDSFIEKGSEDYIVKPIRRKLLLKKVDDLMRVKAAAAERARVEAELQEKEAENRRLRASLVAAADTSDMVDEAPGLALAQQLREIFGNADAVLHLTHSAPQLFHQLRSVMDTLARGGDIYVPQLTSPEKHDDLMSSWLHQYAKPQEQPTAAMVQSAVTAREESGGGDMSSRSNMPVDQLVKWDFDAFLVPNDEIVLTVLRMFEHFELGSRLKVPARTLLSFLTVASTFYVDNPYHNLMHALDVTQAVFSLLTSMNAARYLTRLEVFALLIAAFCHDAGHPGTNNQFQIAVESDVALLYNDQSVLENFHAATIFRIGKSKGCEIFDHFSPEDRRRVREVIVSSVLATDLAHHLKHVSRLEARIQAGHSGSLFSKEIPQDRLDLCVLLLKLADISNVARPLPIARKWNKCVANEFFMQGDLERAKGLPVTPHLDRNRVSGSLVTVNFIDLIARNFISAMTDVLGGDSSELLVNTNLCRSELSNADLELSPASSAAGTGTASRSSSNSSRKSSATSKTRHLSLSPSPRSSTSHAARAPSRRRKSQGSVLTTSPRRASSEGAKLQRELSARDASILRSLSDRDGQLLDPTHLVPSGEDGPPRPSSVSMGSKKMSEGSLVRGKAGERPTTTRRRRHRR
jgi:CheY-like chemotaxis protein